LIRTIRGSFFHEFSLFGFRAHPFPILNTVGSALAIGIKSKAGAHRDFISISRKTLTNSKRSTFIMGKWFESVQIQDVSKRIQKWPAGRTEAL
jgi:hypothetical protein